MRDFNIGGRGAVLAIDDGTEFEYGRIQRTARRPGVEADTITVAANSTERDVELTSLEVWDGWLAQYRLLDLANEVPNDVTIEMDLGGQQAPRWTLKNGRGSIDRSTGTVTAWDENASAPVVEEVRDEFTEVFVLGDQVPYLTVRNEQGSQVSVDLTWTGYIYELEQASAQDDAPAIPVASISGD